MPVVVSGQGRWTLEVLGGGPTTSRGHMIGAVRGLAAAMHASVAGGSAVSLDQPNAGALVEGTGSETVAVDLHQSVQAVDPPGTYSIVLTFIIVAGF